MTKAGRFSTVLLSAFTGRGNVLAVGIRMSFTPCHSLEMTWWWQQRSQGQLGTHGLYLSPIWMVRQRGAGQETREVAVSTEFGARDMVKGTSSRRTLAIPPAHYMIWESNLVFLCHGFQGTKRRNISTNFMGLVRRWGESLHVDLLKQCLAHHGHVH